MKWVLVPWGHQWRRELNELAPKRDKASDGTIGDPAHQRSVSGHNPDDTPGVRAERNDGDGIPEVRAVDTDKDLNVPGVTMEMLVAWLVGRCRAGLEKRFIYLIYKRVIWSASTGWQPRTYTGSNPHDSHLHKSGDPRHDDDDRPFGLAAVLNPKPKPKPSTRPAPGPVVAFPLPAGHYFGPKSGPNKSVSGHYGRRFKGKTDREWIKTFAGQMAKRGWAVGKGKTWLKRHGNDGLWGAEYEALVRAFQRDQKVPVSGRLDERTWNAAYRNPIT